MERMMERVLDKKMAQQRDENRTEMVQVAKKVLDQRTETFNVKVQEIDNCATALEVCLKKVSGEAADIKEELLKKSCKKLADKADKKVVTKSAKCG